MTRPLFLLPMLVTFAGALHAQSSSELDPDISANEMLGTANLTTADSLFVEIELHAGDSTGTMAEWWIVATAGEIIFYFDASTETWKEGVAVSMQSSLADLPPWRILELPAPLPAGEFTFYFGIDTLINGDVDLDYLTYSAVTINIVESASGSLSMIAPYADVNDVRSIWPYRQESHRGVDFATHTELRPFQAAASGTVGNVELVQLQSTGNWQVEVEIKFDDTYTMYYAFEPFSANRSDGETQLENIIVETGQSVAQGQTIGSLFTAGQPGMGAHVHFSLFKYVPNGGDPAVCPEPYFTAAVSSEILDIIRRDDPQLQICN